MKPEKILKLAIEKAVKNGWIMFGYFPQIKRDEVTWKISVHYYGRRPCLRFLSDSSTIERDYYVEQIIFDHDFAKAFWGSSMVAVHMRKGTIYWDSWEYHLQQMVLEKEPLKYLEKFL